jgi:hypothetical protein
LSVEQPCSPAFGFPRRRLVALLVTRLAGRADVTAPHYGQVVSLLASIADPNHAIVSSSVAARMVNVPISPNSRPSAFAASRSSSPLMVSTRLQLPLVAVGLDVRFDTYLGHIVGAATPMLAGKGRAISVLDDHDNMAVEEHNAEAEAFFKKWRETHDRRPMLQL